MDYILVLILATQNGITSSLGEFKSKARCEHVKAVIERESPNNFHHIIKCVPK